MADMEKIRVLLVEDDEDDYIITKNMLKEIKHVDFTLDWAADYKEARRLIESGGYDVFLFDFNIGEYNGLDLVGAVNESKSRTPVIILTGESSRDADLAAMREGVSDYLVKGKTDPSMLERSIRYSLERRKAEEKIAYLAYYDQLTSLPNRMLFDERLQMALSASRRDDRTIAVFFIDLDNFKRINDTLGHRVGDLLLVEVSRRLHECIRESDTVGRNYIPSPIDTVARFGGDEFLILLSEVKYPENSTLVAKRILTAFRQPFVIEKNEIFATMSIGISVYPLDGQTAEELLMNADAAMYQAKNSGKNSFQYFNNELNLHTLHDLVLENDLRKAVAREEFVMFYQPIVACATGNIIKLEALIRWNHPVRGVLSPDEFIPFSERANLIVPIGGWAVSEAFAQYRRWRDLGMTVPVVTVNISVKQLKDQGFADMVKELIRRYGIGDGAIEFEITENLLMEHSASMAAVLDTLIAMGITLSIDDFGTGFSSFKRLKIAPVSTLKINREFIQQLTVSSYDTAIIESIITLGAALGKLVVAEGVETAEQFNRLRELGCHAVQGYLLCEPRSGEKITDVLRAEASGMGIGRKFFQA